jgi:acetolactate synthase-1/2/3 large subunit
VRERLWLPGLGKLSVDFGRTDFAAVARALGGRGVDATSRAELRAAVEAGLDAETFTLVAAHIDRQAHDGRF